MSRKTYDCDSGLAIMINLYIIKYLYYHTEKAECFMYPPTVGKKRKAKSIYEQIDISRQRFDRINKGYTFEMSKGQAEKITNMFGIETIYFLEQPQKFFDIGISELEWKSFYYQKHQVTFKNSSNYTNNATEVEKALRSVAEPGWEERLAVNDPLYQILYYFKYGEKRTKISPIKMLGTALESINYDEWEKIPIQELKRYKKLMETHYNYIDALLMLDKIKKNK